MSTVKSPPRALRNWPSDQKVYPRLRPRPAYPSDENARRRARARGTKPTALEMETLVAVMMAGRPFKAAQELGVSPAVVGERLKRLSWRAGGGGWPLLIRPLLIRPLQRKVERLERELAAARATIEILHEAQEQAA